MAQEFQQEPECQANGNDLMISKDTIEYKLLLSYALRNGTANIQTEESTKILPAKPKDRHKKGRPRFSNLISCVRPPKEKHNKRRKASASNECQRITSAPGQPDVEEIVETLTQITHSVHYVSDVETDSGDLVDQIVEILRDQGDKLNDKIEKDHALKKQLQASMSYSFFEQVANAFQNRLSPAEQCPSRGPEQTHIALACELTSRLNAIDRHPMNRVLGFGARYLQNNFSPWVQQQGGYQNVFIPDDADEEDVH